MNGAPLLNAVLDALAEARLEAILIGNAAAAIHGAPVTTLDFDFMFRSTRTNLAKLKRFADHLQAVILRPYYPVSGLYRVVNEDRGLQVDFMSSIHGIKSFNSLRSRAERLGIGGRQLWVARLEDIIASKRATGRARDLAVLQILEATLRETVKGEKKP
jgi:predicted nucleotidyltransferase